MAERTANCHARANGRSSLCNWLKELDRQVRKLPTGANWLEEPIFGLQRCRLFMMVRYPRLIRPFRDEVIDREILRGERQIAEHPCARQVLNRLRNRHRKQLAALLLDTIMSFQSYETYKTTARRVQKLASEAPSRIGMLNKKLRKVRRALHELGVYAETLGPALISIQEVHKVTDACLEKLSTLGRETPKFYQSLKSEYAAIEDPAGLAMVQLYWFFRGACGLPGREAEVRVALIRNAFWTKYGVTEVPVRSEYKTGESRGCNAVHVAVLRYHCGTS